jgi:lactoylglutathione lyase
VACDGAGLGAVLRLKWARIAQPEKNAMAKFAYDHIHLRSPNVEETAQWYERMFGAEIIRSIQSDGRPRVDLNLGGVSVFLAQVPAEQAVAQPPQPPFLGLEHIGLRVEGIDSVVAELKDKGAEFTVEPRTIRPGVRIAFLRGPQNVHIELLDRNAA